MGGRRYLIAGNGVAAVKAVEGIRRVDRESSLTVLAREEGPAYSPILTTYLIAGEIRPEEAWYRTAGWYERMGAELAPGAEAVRVDAAARAVECGDGRTRGYDRLLIATGASPVIPDIPGARLAGAQGLRTLQDAAGIRGRLRPGLRAVVVGGGLVACKAAEALRRAGAEVEMVVGSGQLFSRYLSEEPAGWIAGLAEAQGVRVRFRAEVARVLGRDEVEGVLTADGERIPCGLVVFGKGVRPNVGMLDPAQVAVRRGVLVDRFLRTSAPGIYAAGDACEGENPITGESGPSAIWPAAVEQGAAAGCNMAGREMPHGGVVNRNVFRFFGATVAFAGLIRPAGEGQRVVEFRDPRRRIFRRIVLDERSRVLGLTMMGDLRGLGRTVALLARESPRYSGSDMPVWRETYI